MKRFLAFGGEVFDEFGGWRDFLGAFDTLEDAQSCASKFQWWHVVDTHAGGVVAADRHYLGTLVLVSDAPEQLGLTGDGI